MATLATPGGNTAPRILGKSMSQAADAATNTAYGRRDGRLAKTEASGHALPLRPRVVRFWQ
jgi:hypothetical protein